MNKLAQILIATAIVAMPAYVAASVPVWFERDSVQAVNNRLKRDFSIPYDQGVQQIQAKYPELTADDIARMVDDKYIEVKTIDGKKYMYRFTLRNLALLHPKYNGGWKHRGYDASPRRISYADSVIRHSRGLLPDGGAHKVCMRFSVDVPYDHCLWGDTLRVWMPYPIESARQGDIRLVSTSQDGYVLSTPDKSVHRTIYMSKPVVAGKDAHFDYTVEFTTSGSYFPPEYIKANIKPYDKDSETYREYTGFAGQHYVRLDSLAHAIVGSETNPYEQSELVYDYIINTYPWARAREYSTIPCIPRYVVEERHGDCGQVALLYISLMRSLGVPARWESGWMLHPGELNFHDWAEVYFEGVGWVPVDPSFGRYATSDDQSIRNFYSTGMDAHRFAANTGVNGVFYPAKRYVRSETVDSQAGEVETSRGNLFYPGWDSNLEIISITPVTK